MATTGTLSRSPKDLLTPSMTMVSLKYHTVPADRIAAVTRRDLASCGIPARALGRVTPEFRVTLVGCVAVNDHARAYLPAALGGTADGLDASDATSRLSEASFALSPAARLRPPSPTSSGAPWSSPRPSPLAPSRTALVRAASDAVDAAEAAEGDAAGSAAAAENAIIQRERALAVLSGAQRRHTRAHPRGSLLEGEDVLRRQRAAPRPPSPRGGVAADLEARLDAAAAAAAPGPALDASALGADAAPRDAVLATGLAAMGLGPTAAPDRSVLPPPDGSSDGSEGARSDDDEEEAAARDTYAALLRAQAAFDGRAAEAVLARQRAAAGAARARELRSSADTSCSALTSAGGASPGGPRPPIDAAREQQSLAASLSSDGLKADVIAGLLGHRKKFPLIMKAMLRRGGSPDACPAELDDLPLLALLPAWQAAQLQEYGLLMLVTAASKAATTPGLGSHGLRACEELTGASFDLFAADAIGDGAVDIEVAPLDICAGVLPVAQLALHLWLKNHRHVVSAESRELETLAAAVSFVSDRVLNPRAGLAAFIPAWARALGHDEEYSATRVYYALLVNLLRDRNAAGALAVSVAVEGVPMTWTAYAEKLEGDWRVLGNKSKATRPQLAALVRTLRLFGERRTMGLGDPLPAPDSDLSPSAFLATLGAALPTATAAPSPAPSRLARSRSPPGGPAPTPAGALRLHTYVLRESPNIMSATPLLAAGWKFTLDSSGRGSSVRVPGVSRPFPLRRDASGAILLSLVATSRGLVLRDGSLAHRCLVAHDFLLDTGAEVCIVGADGIDLLSELGTLRPLAITGVGGVRTQSLETGVLIIAPPKGALAPPPGSASSTAATTGMVNFASIGATAAELQLCASFAGFPLDPPDDEPDDSPTTAVLAASVRATAFPPAQSLPGLCEKFNLNTAASLGAFIDACPLGIASGLRRGIVPGTDYSRGLASAALLKTPAIHASRYSYSATLHGSVPPGCVWWTDVSNVRPPDFDGNIVSRLFAEERTGCATTFYSPRKDAATLIEQLDELVTWINQHVPGGRLMILRGDFASEAVRQGHGDAVYTAAMSAYCDSHPGFRFMPVAPHSQALNRAENTWGRIHGGAYLNARRARIGAPGWSLMERCAVFQHNHTPAPHAIDPASRRCSRWEALTQETFDVSTMLGFPGQSGFTHRADGKANAYRTPTDPVLYLYPATSLHAQLVFNLRSFKIMVVRSVALTVHPYACALAIAGSALHSPAGDIHTPSADAYAARLDSLLTWRPVGPHDTAVVLNDPLHGLPMAIFDLTASVADDGTLVMSYDDGAPDELSTPLDAACAPAGPDAAAAGSAEAPSAPGALAHDPPSSASAGHGAWVPSWTSGWAPGAASALAKLVADHTLDPSAAPWHLAFAPDRSKRLTTASGRRYAAYSGATTALAFKTAYDACPPADKQKTWFADLSYDLGHGLLAVAPGPAHAPASPAPSAVPAPAVLRVVSDDERHRSSTGAAGSTARRGRGRHADSARLRVDATNTAPACAPHPTGAAEAGDAGTASGTVRGGRPPRDDTTRSAGAGPPGPFGEVWHAIKQRIASRDPSARRGSALTAPPGWSPWGPVMTSSTGPTAASRAVHIANLDRTIAEADAPRVTSSYVSERRELDRIDRLEPSPLPGRSPGPDTFPDASGDPRLYTDAYHRGARVLRVALSADYGDDTLLEPDLVLLAKTLPSWGSTDRLVPPALAHMAAPMPGAPAAPASVAAARALPDFEAPHGWRAAIGKEISRVEGFRAWRLASAQEVQADRRLYGDARVSIGYIVAVLTCKLDPAGGPRSQEVLNKFRVAIADKADAAAAVITHSNCADEISNRLITAIAPAIGAHQDSIDVGGAYFHGIPLSMLLGGRRLYVRIPAWLAALFPAYPLRGKGGTNFLLIVGNMPGRCDAGRIWQSRFDQFLVGYGLSQLLVDRRVWTGHSARGKLIVHDHVDDSRITSTTVAARVHFHEAWAREFGETIVTRALSEDFTGLRHHVVGPYTTTISCEGVIQRLAALLAPYPLDHNERCDWPLAAQAPRVLLEGPSALRPLAPHLVAAAGPILGTCGFVGGLARPDGHYGYSLLSKHADESRLTTYVFRCIVRLGHYLVRTKGLHLHLTTPRLVLSAVGSSTLDLFACFVDSSHGNGENGASHGGFLIASCAPPAPPSDLPAAPPSAETELGGGGAIAWRCVAPSAGDDSSAAAELRLATLAYKYVISARFLQCELDVGAAPAAPTPLYLDAQAVLDGTHCERLSKASRWMAMRYAMLRWGIACGTISPRKLLTARNPADGLTKCLTGKPFENGRARLLGLPVPHPEL